MVLFFQNSADALGKIPVIMLSISYKGVKFIDAKTKVRFYVVFNMSFVKNILFVLSAVWN